MKQAACVLMLLSLPAMAAAQSTAALDQKIHERWAVILAEVARSHGKTLADRVLTATDDEKRAIYREAIERLSDDRELMALARPDLTLVNERTRADERAFLDQLKTKPGEEVEAKSVDGASTNAAAGQLTERSGFSESLAVALRGQNLINADANAISLNLSALALYRLADPEVYSELHRYQQHSLIRRFGGTLTSGAKVPEKEITGISNLPDADKLVDVVTWDVKVRVLGDKDVRSALWYGLTLGRGGALTQMSAVVPADVPISDLPLIQPLLQDALGANLDAMLQRIRRSPQLSFKTAGTHVRREPGKDKFSGGLFLDSGIGSADLTANLVYSVTDDVRLGVAKAFQIKQTNVSAMVTSHFARDVFVRQRAVQFKAGTVVTVFNNRKVLPIPVKNTWKVYSGVEIPFGDRASIPLSIVYTNDANALKDTKYVSGQVGISYDFSAFKTMFKQ